MGWETSDRRSRLPRNWSKITSKVLKRDGYTCCWILEDSSRCKNKATDVDHISPGDNHELWNLQALCEYHHDRKSAKEGSEAMNLKRAKIHNKFRRDEAHPSSRR